MGRIFQAEETPENPVSFGRMDAQFLDALAKSEHCQRENANGEHGRQNKERSLRLCFLLRWHGPIENNDRWEGLSFIKLGLFVQRKKKLQNPALDLDVPIQPDVFQAHFGNFPDSRGKGFQLRPF